MNSLTKPQSCEIQDQASLAAENAAKPCLFFYLNDEAQKKGITFNPPRPGDAGYDVRCLESTAIAPQRFKLIRTGLHIAVPDGWVALLRDRSSVALRGGVVAGGVIDASYRGEIHVLIHNLGSQTLRFEQGERIAQCVVVAHLSGALPVEELSELGSTQRGASGFGSTGRL